MEKAKKKLREQLDYGKVVELKRGHGERDVDQDSFPINKIVPNPENPRIIKDKKFKQLVESIRSFPDMLKLRPIVVNSSYMVLGGNMRLKACQEAGLKEIPIKIAHLTEEQQKEFIIKDNSSFGEWDWDTLAANWDSRQLEDWGMDLPADFGGKLEAEEDDFDVPQGGSETDIVLGDLFEIGEHRLMCGDSTSSVDVQTLTNGNRPSLMVTDPH